MEAGGCYPSIEPTAVRVQLGAVDSSVAEEAGVYPIGGTGISREPTKTPVQTRRQRPFSPQTGLGRGRSSIVGPMS